MISIVICTVQLNKLTQIERNISETISVEYELIVIDNSNANYNIFQAYNIGVERSKFDILCFMHDDIVYHTANWGNAVLNHFGSEETGMIGIGGTRFLSSIPTIWWAGGERFSDQINGPLCINCIQTDRNHPHKSLNSFINPENNIRTKVVALDGLWFCIRKDLFEKIRFDDINYSGFHFYDLDICMQIGMLNQMIYCIFDITIEHISSSKHDQIWIQNCETFYRKWKSYLPISQVKLTLNQIIKIECDSFKNIYQIYRMQNLSFPILRIMQNIHISNFLFFHFKHLVSGLKTK
jgi:hypothetical protein